MTVEQLARLAIQVMLPVFVLVGAGGMWPAFSPGVGAKRLRIQLNRMVLNLFYPAIIFAVAASTPLSRSLLSVPLVVAVGALTGGLAAYLLLYRTALGTNLQDGTRAALVIGAMFGNTFNIGLPVLVFLFGEGAARYPVYIDMLMTVPLTWSLGVWIATRLGSHRPEGGFEPVWRVLVRTPPIGAFLLGVVLQQAGFAPRPLVDAARLIGQATIPVVLFVLGLSIPWRALRADRAILAVAGIKLLVAPAAALLAAVLWFAPVGEPQRAAVVECATPTMLTLLVLVDRYRLDMQAAALLIAWSTILFWFTLPLVLVATR